MTSAQVRFKDPTRTAQTTARAVQLHAPNSLYGNRFSQVDLALSKSFNLGWGRLRTAIDVYNAFNSNSIQSVVTAYTSARWLRPVTFLDPRLARVTATINF